MKLELIKTKKSYKIKCPNCGTIVRRKYIPASFECSVCAKSYSIHKIPRN